MSRGRRRSPNVPGEEAAAGQSRHYYRSWGSRVPTRNREDPVGVGPCPEVGMELRLIRL